MEEAKGRQHYLQVITRKLVLLTILSLVLLALLYSFIRVDGSDRTFLILYIFFAGLVGGFVSIQQRLPSIQMHELQELSHSWTSILLIPINGGVFAIVLTIIFLAGILEGSMFPEFSHPEIDHADVADSFLKWLTVVFPSTGNDIAKLLFWSFVAGFSERFVPQVIRKTTSSGD